MTLLKLAYISDGLPALLTHLLKQSKIQTFHQVSVLHVTSQELGLLDQLAPLFCCRLITGNGHQVQNYTTKTKCARSQLYRKEYLRDLRLGRRPDGSVVSSGADELRLFIVFVDSISPFSCSVSVFLSQLSLSLHLLLT